MAKVGFSRWPPRGHKIGQIVKIKKRPLGVLPRGILTPSFIEIGPEVTKRASPTDDNDDGRHVTAIAHQR
jgi:hypothetical protein